VIPVFRAAPDAGGAPLALGVTVQGVEDGTGLPAGAEPALLAAAGFTGAGGESTLTTDPDGAVTVLVGLGEAGEVDAAAARRAGATLARVARRLPEVATTLAADAAAHGSGDTAEHLVQAVVEGVALKSYAYDRYRTDPESSDLAEVVLVGADGGSVQRAARVADAVCLTRDLVNEPGGSLTPLALAEAASDVAQRENLQLTVLDEAAIREAKLGGLLGVNRGSSQPPVFIQLAYEPPGAGPDTPTLALVGKGITFDAGGLSIKTADGMLGMKGDMGGAGAVLGAMSAVAALSPSVRVAAYLPCTDNMLGPDATRPGDVLTIRGGTTVEITNTDAEGRLVLADALVLAAEGGPAAILDLATLTGACMVALGPRWAGLMGNHDGWLGQIEAAAARAGETVWRLPLPSEYHELIESPIADLRNSTSTRYGGALTAGLFLQDFVGEVPWAHLDIAGPAFADEVLDLGPKGGTGFGVRTILELVQAFEVPSPT
jgi:leucyl aminopeptidase